MTLQDALTDESGNQTLPQKVEGGLKAEDLWPFAKVEPTFEDYLKWLDEMRRMQGLLDSLNMPRSFTPRPYQVEGALHLKKVVRGMIYDQPGLGKTLQSAMALSTPAIISCPGYLVDQWCDFLEDQYPQWKVARINALLGKADRQALLAKPHDIWVVNHEMWASRREPFQGGPKPKKGDANYSWWEEEKWKRARMEHYETAKKTGYNWPHAATLVIDESHHMRNKTASQSECIANYADTTDQVILLTATPQYKDVRDWWHQLRIMDPRYYTEGLGRQRRWLDDYTYVTGWNDSLIKVRPTMAKPLQDEIGRYAIGRTYAVVGLYLPDLIEKVVKVQWDKDLKKHYDELKNNFRISTNEGYDLAVNPAGVLHTLRMFTANPEKVDAVKHIVEDIPDDGSPIIIFCWYRDTAELLEHEFATSPSSVEITGAYSQKERLARATALDTRVKCVTMASMSEGVDWSAAKTVIFFEEDYTPGKIYQALSRVRRHSEEGAQNKTPVVVYYVHIRNSVDEAIHEAVTERQGDVRRILRRALK